MAQVNPLTRELLVKLVYYGPGLGGKTTSLQCIHRSSPAETRGQLVSLATPVDRTLYFDFLPLRATTLREHHVRLQLFTVPGQVYFNATRKLVLTGADGVIFVADSQRGRHDANLESFENLANNLEEQGRSLAEVPLVLQYNKRDLDGVMSVEEMDGSLNTLGAPAVATCATSGEGILDALDELVRSVLSDIEATNALGPEGVTVRQPAFGRTEAALEEQIGRASDTWHGAVTDGLADAPPSTDAPEASPADTESSQEDAGGASEPPPSAMPPALMAPFERSNSERPSPLASRSPSVVPLEALPEPSTLGASVSASTGPSWVPLFADDADEVRTLEADLQAGRISDAILRCDGLVQRLLRHAGKQAGLSEVLREPALVAPMLGLEGERWFAFRRLIRRARTGGPLDARDGLSAYAILIEIRLRRDRVLG